MPQSQVAQPSQAIAPTLAFFSESSPRRSAHLGQSRLEVGAHRPRRPCLLPESDLDGRLPRPKHGLSVTETSKRIDADFYRRPDIRPPDDSTSARPPVGSTKTKGRNDMSIEMNRLAVLPTAVGVAGAASLTAAGRLRRRLRCRQGRHEQQGGPGRRAARLCAQHGRQAGHRVRQAPRRSGHGVGLPHFSRRAGHHGEEDPGQRRSLHVRHAALGRHPARRQPVPPGHVPGASRRAGRGLRKRLLEPAPRVLPGARPVQLRPRGRFAATTCSPTSRSARTG